MKLLSALFAAALMAGPAAAGPSLPAPVAVPLPYCDALGLVSSMRSCRPRPELTAAQKAQQQEWQRVLHLQGLKEKADKVCRVTVDIRLFNPYGGKWASKGDYIAAAAASGEHESISTRPWVTDDYAHLVKDCPLGRMAQYAGNSAEANRAFVSSYLPSAPIAGGPVYVRSHQRCNSSKCWNVRAYTRSR